MFLCKDIETLECKVIVRGYLAESLPKYINCKKANELVDNDNFHELFTVKPCQKLPIPLVHLTSKAQLGNKDSPIFYKKTVHHYDLITFTSAESLERFLDEEFKKVISDKYFDDFIDLIDNFVKI